MRCTVAWPTPAWRAIERQDQCVSPAGLVCKVSATMASTRSAVIVGLRPRPGRTLPSFLTPSCPKRSRHEITLDRDTPTCSAISVLPTPVLARNRTRARSTSLWDSVCDFDSDARDSLCSSDSTSAAGGLDGMSESYLIRASITETLH